MNIFEIQGTVMEVAVLALLVVKAGAFINSLMFSAEAYVAAGKLTKVAWCTILGLSVAIDLLMGWGLLSIVGTIAAFVYLADVRPALREVTARR